MLFAYVVVFGSVIAMFGALGTLIQSLTGIPFLWLGAMLLPVLSTLIAVLIAWIIARIGPPNGIEITRAAAPDLFVSIERLVRQVGAPRIHKVLINTEYEMRIVRRRRLRGLPWNRNYLLLGLPMMQSLPVAELEALLVRALTAFSIGVDRSWVRIHILSALLRDTGALVTARFRMTRAWFRRFLEWYSSRITALEDRIVRRRELDLDRAAARVVGPATLGAAIIRARAVGRQSWQMYWDDVDRRADTEPRPPQQVFRDFGSWARGGIVHETLRFEEALARATRDSKDVISVSERLAVLGVASEYPPAFEASAADALLSEALGPVEKLLSSTWSEHVESIWKRRFDAAIVRRTRLAELDKELVTASHDVKLAWERAQLLWHDGRPSDFEAALIGILELQPEFAPALGILGRMRLERGDGSGLEQIERATQLSSASERECCRAARDYLLRVGRADDAARYAERYRVRVELEERDAAERNALTFDAPFDPHGLDPETIERVAVALRKITGIRRAYLVRRRLTAMPDPPVFVLGIATVPWWLPYRPKREIVLRDRALNEVPLPGVWHCFAVDRIPSGKLNGFRSAAGRSLV